MNTKKLVVVECLYKDDVAFFDEEVGSYLNEGVIKCLDNNNKDDFGVYIFLEHLLE